MRTLAFAVTLLSCSAALASAPAPTKDVLAKGKAAFDMTCAACHGAAGAGDGVAAVALTPKPRNFQTDAFKNGDKAENVFKTISEGIPATAMVAFAYLPEADRWALAHYVLELRNAGKAAKK